MNREDKANEVVKSITPAQLARTRSDIHAEIESGKDEGESPSSQEPCEDSRLAKLDLISDVQLILIDKYRSGAKLMVAAITVMVFILAAQILQFSRTLSLHGRVIVLAEKQETMMKEQQKLIEDSAESKKGVEQVRVAVARTEEKVDEAVEASPKLEYDPDSGKTKVVVPVKRPKDGGDKPDKTGGDKKGTKGGGSKGTMSHPAPPPPPVEYELK